MPDMAIERRDVVVVGAGVAGLSAAAELSRRGRDVLCLEQASVGHAGAGSKGTARIFRFGYDDPLYVDMARRSLEGWRSLEREADETLLATCGLLSFGAGLGELVEGMRAAGADAEYIAAGDVSRLFPDLVVGGEAVLDPFAGILLADRILRTLRAAGRFEIREGVRVRVVDPGDDHVVLTTEVDTDTGTDAGADAAPIEAARVVVCAGPFSMPLLATAGIPCSLSATLEQVAYFAPHDGRKGGLPELPAIALREGAGVDSPQAEQLVLYGLPDLARGSYKVGLHHAGPVVDAGQEAAWPEEPDHELVARIVDAVKEMLPGFDPEPRQLERCVYDNTADGDFVIDRVGPVVVGAGTSGHGFKFGPLLGRVLADLASDTDPEIDLSRFALGAPRFS